MVFSMFSVDACCAASHLLNMNKKALSERDICTKFITPNLVSAGWDINTQIREEVGFTDGRMEIEHRRTHAAHLLHAVLKEAFAPV